MLPPLRAPLIDLQSLLIGVGQILTASANCICFPGFITPLLPRLSDLIGVGNHARQPGCFIIDGAN
jgi:hypothetical protein